MIIRWTLLVAPLVMLLGCSSPTPRSEEVQSSEGVEMPDESQRPGESSEERRERLEREWAEYYGSNRPQAKEPMSPLARFLALFGNMIVFLPLILAFYVLTRMSDVLIPSHGDGRPRMFVRILAGVTFVITALALVGMVAIMLWR